MNEINDPKPINITVTNTKGVFGTSSITYNETGLTYNEVGQIYGGVDTVDSTVPQLIGIQTSVSNNQMIFVPLSTNIAVENSQSIFGSSAITYNESAITYNESNQLYGGADILSGVIPKMIQARILIGETGGIGTLPAGMPMGLLLTVTYPTVGTVSL